MKVAVPFDNDNILHKFGMATAFEIYEVEQGKLKEGSTLKVADPNSQEKHSHAGLAEKLKAVGVDTAICDGIGTGALNALQGAGLKVYRGVSGRPIDAVSALMIGLLG